MKLCVIPGDGIGIEVVESAVRVLQAMPIAMEFVEKEAGWGTFQKVGTALPDDTLATARESDAILFGAVASPSHPVEGYRSPIVGLRRALNLYANIRPTTNKGLAQSSTLPVDMIVVRENTEGLYSGRERLEDDGATAIAERVITRQGTSRIVRKALELVQERAARGENEQAKSKKLTLVHKANVLRVSDGLFREVALEVAKEYPDVIIEELLVDTAAMHVARSPERFNVLVTSNLFGDILSDISCIHGGGLGLASSANIGEHKALFEPVHGAAPDIAGDGIANPLAIFGCLVMMLEYGAQRQADTSTADNLNQLAQKLRLIVQTVLAEGPHTPDMGGNACTNDVTNAVIEQLS